MVTGWIDLARRGVKALERIADALEDHDARRTWDQVVKPREPVEVGDGGPARDGR